MKFVTNHFKLCPFMLLPSLLAFYAVLWCNKDSFRQDFSSSGKKKALSLEAKSSVFKIYILHNAFVLNLNILKNFSAFFCLPTLKIICSHGFSFLLCNSDFNWWFQHLSTCTVMADPSWSIANPYRFDW